MQARLAAVAVLLGCSTSPSPPAAPPPPPITSTFDTDVDGWSLRGFNTDGSDYSIGTMTVAGNYDATGGNPGGAFLRHEEFVGETDYFSAPAKFGGDLSAYVGGTLVYDFRASDLAEPFSAPQVVLMGAGVEWRFDSDDAGSLSWATQSVPMDGGAQWSRIDGTTVTAAAFLASLGAVTGVWIRGEYSSDFDDSWLDNVTLSN